MKLTKSQLKEIIIEETQRVLIEKEYIKYIETNVSRLLAEGKSQEEIEELLTEELGAAVKRLAKKYALPAMAIASILTSTPAYAGAGPEPEPEAAAAVQELPPEQEKSFWDDVGDFFSKLKPAKKPVFPGRSMLNLSMPGMTEPGEQASEPEAAKPKTSKEWFNANRDLMRKHGVTKIVIDGELMGGKFTPSKKMAKKYNIKGDIDLSSATTDAEKTHLIYKHVLEPGAK
tara:strand:- start:30569 stop:31258 length:690 start_codon:yes stop_codon:yes gene_type:complete